jgi:hypothetical protein
MAVFRAPPPFFTPTQHFDVPKGQQPGPSVLQVVANGIASPPVFVWIY